jgi:hypothetical protein
MFAARGRRADQQLGKGRIGGGELRGLIDGKRMGRSPGLRRGNAYDDDHRITI